MKHLLYLLLFLPAICSAQWSRPDNLKPKVTEALKSLDENPGYYSEYVGYAGSASAQYKAFRQISRHATLANLARLTYDINPTVRIYAFDALLEKDTSVVLAIAMEHLADTAMVKTLDGCIGGLTSVGDAMFNQLVYTQRLSLSTRKRILRDSSLIFGEHPIYFDDKVRYAISPATASEQEYQLLRQMATDGDAQATQTISRFQKPADLPLLLSLYPKHPREFFRAVEWFGHQPEFISIYEDYAKGIMTNTRGHSPLWRSFYQLVAERNDDWSLKILRQPLTEAMTRPELAPYAAEYIFMAIEDIASPRYDKLFPLLWNNHRYVSTHAYRRMTPSLISADLFLREAMANFDEIENPAASYSDPYDLRPELIRQLQELPKADFLRITGEKLSNASVHNVPFFIPLIDNRRYPSLTQIALSRLQKEDNPHVYKPLLRQVLIGADEDIRSRVTKIYRLNKALRKGWAREETLEILREGGVKI